MRESDLIYWTIVKFLFGALAVVYSLILIQQIACGGWIEQWLVLCA